MTSAQTRWLTQATINRTTFGIETNLFWNWVRNISKLSIEPLLELKHSLLLSSLFSSYYQSNHFWNWNIFAPKIMILRHFAINRTTFGIETYIHTMQVMCYNSYQSNHFWNWNYETKVFWANFSYTINRTTFGIETDQISCCHSWK